MHFLDLLATQLIQELAEAKVGVPGVLQVDPVVLLFGGFPHFTEIVLENG